MSAELELIKRDQAELKKLLEALSDALTEAKDEINDNLLTMKQELQEKIMSIDNFQRTILEPNQQTIHKAILGLEDDAEEAKFQTESE